MLYPEGIKCNLCGKELFEETRFSLCPDCIPTFVGKPCLRCGRSISNDAEFCLECQNGEHFFDSAYAPVVFDGTAVKLIYKLKYGNEKYLAKYLARMMFDCFEKQSYIPDLITFVPMHEKRQKNRGYNQAEELAKELGEIMGLDVVNSLQRSVFTDNLARMNAQERRNVIQNAITLNKSAPIKGKQILLVDDVFTTGATSNACTEVLKRGGAKRVEVLTFATAKEIPLLI